MRVALANAKGGVAKTTSCIYLAAVLARRGIEVAVYDADPQSSASLWAAARRTGGRSAAVRRAAGQHGHPRPQAFA